MNTIRCCFRVTAILAVTISASVSVAANDILIEAESFGQPGGWKLDTQFIEVMGSPYLLAHGLGRPVADATTTVEVADPGEYHVFVRTKDWVALWDAPGAPGKFQISIDGETLDHTFGTQGKAWHWEYGGSINIQNKRATLALKDQTGFDGRCDAILLSRHKTPPPNESDILPAWRRKTTWTT